MRYLIGYIVGVLLCSIFVGWLYGNVPDDIEQWAPLTLFLSLAWPIFIAVATPLCLYRVGRFIAYRFGRVPGAIK